MTYDYSQDVEPVSGDLLQQISKVAQEQIDAESVIKDLEKDLEEAQAALKLIKTQRLPELMQSAAQSEITTLDGLVVKMKRVIRASIKKDAPDDQREIAFSWLETNEHGSIIENTITVEFGKDEGDLAKELATKIQQLTNRPVRVEKGVHHSRLTSLLNELLNSDEPPTDVPMEAMGAFDTMMTSVTAKKARKVSK